MYRNLEEDIMITLTTIRVYRVTAIVAALAPILLIALFEPTIVASLLYIPISSLSLALLAKYVDFHLVKTMLLQQTTVKLNQGLKVITTKDKISKRKIAA